MRVAARLIAATLLALTAALAFAQAPPKPGPKDLCPVCGMLVSKYPNWVATVVWKDERVRHFDGAKDLFRYLLELHTYEPGRRRAEIKMLTVTDFYNLEKIDARQAWYVIGSNVLGPMGHDMVPLASRADADDFLKDHKGRTILRFEDITAKTLVLLENGTFEATR